MNRRDFIRTTGVSAAALAFGQPSSLFALDAENAYRKNMGIQLYTLRSEIGKDPVSTMKQVAADGYQQVELFGFPNADAMVSAARDAGRGRALSRRAGSIPRSARQHTAEYGVFEDLVKAMGRLDGTKLGRVKCKNDADALPQADTRVRLWVMHFRGSDSEIKSLIYL